MLNILLTPLLQVAMADALRQDGKFWVVVAVIFATVGGLLAYLVTLDKKVKAMEKSREEKLQQ